MNKIIHNGLTRAEMIHMIHCETDTSSWARRASDEELIEGFKEIFGDI